MEWGLDWLNTVLRVLLPIWLLGVLWRPRAVRVREVQEVHRTPACHPDKTGWRLND